MSIPNLITLGRVILVPVVFWLLLTGELKAAFLVFVVAGISDAVDGFLAKRFNWETELGAYLDPIADKLLIVCIFIALGVTGRLPSWLVIMVVSRDVLIVIAVVLSWLLGNPTPMKPLAVSKINTVRPDRACRNSARRRGFRAEAQWPRTVSQPACCSDDGGVARCIFTRMATPHDAL